MSEVWKSYISSSQMRLLGETPHMFLYIMHDWIESFSSSDWWNSGFGICTVTSHGNKSVIVCRPRAAPARCVRSWETPRPHRDRKSGISGNWSQSSILRHQATTKPLSINYWCVRSSGRVRNFILNFCNCRTGWHNQRNCCFTNTFCLGKYLNIPLRLLLWWWGGEHRIYVFWQIFFVSI